ncbi:MAG: transposase [Nitrospirota bacterium]|nr:transposase [Nitrospirota bacterium]MDH5701005.1 transposase [Nitrospirota bacterium]
MARKPRVEFPGALYHVIARGNRRTTLFHDEADYAAYLERLERYRRRDSLRCYAFILMSNHLHLLVETGEVPLSRTMQTLQFTYTQYYNGRYRKIGHLFQGRYKAILCDRDTYLLELVRYLHLNPARLRQPQDPWGYPWSSHGVYLGQSGPVEIETLPILEQFHRQVGPARKAYRQFLQEGLGMGHQAHYYEAVDQRFLGDERFLAELQGKTKAKNEVTVKGPKVSFPRILQAVAETTGYSPDHLVRAGRERNPVATRAFLVYAAREWSDLSVKEIGRRLNRDPSMISRLYAGYALKRTPSLEKQVRAILKK